jgi:hypothetical protein
LNQVLKLHDSYFSPLGLGHNWPIHSTQSRTNWINSGSNPSVKPVDQADRSPLSQFFSHYLALAAQGLGLPAQGFTLAAQGLGLPAQGFTFAAQGLGFAAQGQGFAAQGFTFAAQGFAFAAQGFAFAAQGFTFAAQGLSFAAQTDTLMGWVRRSGAALTPVEASTVVPRAATIANLDR